MRAKTARLYLAASGRLDSGELLPSVAGLQVPPQARASTEPTGCAFLRCRATTALSIWVMLGHVRSDLHGYRDSPTTAKRCGRSMMPQGRHRGADAMAAVMSQGTGNVLHHQMGDVAGAVGGDTRPRLRHGAL